MNSHTVAKLSYTRAFTLNLQLKSIGQEVRTEIQLQTMSVNSEGAERRWDDV